MIQTTTQTNSSPKSFFRIFLMVLDFLALLATGYAGLQTLAFFAEVLNHPSALPGTILAIAEPLFLIVSLIGLWKNKTWAYILSLICIVIAIYILLGILFGVSLF